MTEARLLEPIVIARGGEFTVQPSGEFVSVVIETGNARVSLLLEPVEARELAAMLNSCSDVAEHHK